MRRCDSVAQAAKCADHFAGAYFLRLGADRGPSLLVTDLWMEHFPDQATQPMRDRPDGFFIGPAPFERLELYFENAAFDFHGGVGGLIQNPAHRLVSLGGSAALGNPGAFLLARTDSDPGSQLLF